MWTLRVTVNVTLHFRLSLEILTVTRVKKPLQDTWTCLDFKPETLQVHLEKLQLDLFVSSQYVTAPISVLCGERGEEGTGVV